MSVYLHTRMYMCNDYGGSGPEAHKESTETIR